MNRAVRREERGQTLVEFALILPILVLVLFGILDLGRAVYAYSTINNAAREAGRLAIVDQTAGHITARATEQAVSLAVGSGDVYVDFRAAATPETENSCDSDVGDPAVVGCLAVVRVSYSYTAATPLISQLVGTIAMSGETRFRIENNCMEPTAPSCPVGD
jgi:Flp pilus assembly protein TadG